MGVSIIGAGLAGSECAWQLAERGVEVELIEQKPRVRTPAQRGDHFAELVCSNSFRGTALHNAVGLLKEEMRRAGSLIMAAADLSSVPAGGALAVDRDVFAADVSRRLLAHPRIRVTAAEVTQVPAARPLVLATGPLTGDALAADLAKAIGQGQLAYYDAIAPVVAADSIDWSRVFRASRYGKGGDEAYVNCPMDEAAYRAFVAAVRDAGKVQPHAFEDQRFFEGCLPIDVMAERGELTLAYGPMKPVGLTDPHTGRRPFAVVQLRQEDTAATAYNLVGFQTRMTSPEQERVFRTIPGLQRAEFLRLGRVHRNTFIDAPAALDEALQLRALPGVHLAGQMTGVEGYIESAACGLCLGVALARRDRGLAAFPPPPTTALGALLSHLRTPRDDFQPSNIVWSMFPPLTRALPPGPGRGRKRRRREAMAGRALGVLGPWLDDVGAGLVRARLAAPAAPRRVPVEGSP